MTHWKTRLLHAADVGDGGFRSLAVPVYRGATVVFPDAASVREGTRPERDGYTYGLYGTPTTVALAERVRMLEGGAGTCLVPSGQAAIALVNLSLLRAGDHVLLPASVYGPSRRLAGGLMRRLGIEAEFYDPLRVEEVRARLRAATRLVWCESPGSITMEVQDVPAIAEVAHAQGALVACDNTWAAGVLFDALGHGADVTMQALTKYVAGHSDVLLGSVTAATDELADRIAATRGALGIGVSPDDCSLALRGLQTMAVRLEAVERSAMEVATWLAGRPEVERVLHPAMTSCPGHEVWKRDFTGSSGLFSFVLRRGVSFAGSRALVDALTLFKQGYSWGGVESLALNYDLRSSAEETNLRRAEGRPAYDWRLIRLQIGLEAVADLIADLEQALARV